MSNLHQQFKVSALAIVVTTAIAAFLFSDSNPLKNKKQDSSAKNSEGNYDFNLLAKASNRLSNEASNTALNENIEISSQAKSSANSRSDKSSDEKNEEFWKDAKIPSELLVSSLPIFQTARIAEGEQSGAVRRDLSESVPGAFSNTEDDDFDYKRANEELYLWLITNPDAATAWLNEQADLANFDLAIRMIAGLISNGGDMSIAEQWLDLIEDPNKRKRAIIDIWAISELTPPPGILEPVINSDLYD